MRHELANMLRLVRLNESNARTLCSAEPDLNQLWRGLSAWARRRRRCHLWQMILPPSFLPSNPDRHFQDCNYSIIPCHSTQAFFGAERGYTLVGYFRLELEKLCTAEGMSPNGFLEALQDWLSFKMSCDSRWHPNSHKTTESVVVQNFTY